MSSRLESRARNLPLPVAASQDPRSQGRAGSRLKKMLDRSQDMQVVQEFRSKLRSAEDLISKLAFSLREIQGVRRKKKDKAAKAPAEIRPLRG